MDIPFGPQKPHPGTPLSPRKTLRERFFHRLPYYTGPYYVGYMDIEVPVRDPRPISKLQREGKPVLRLDTVLMGVYYPANLREAALSSNGDVRLHRIDWMPRPRLPTANGYAKFLGLPSWLFTSYFASTSLFTKLPAFRNAKLAGHWPEQMLEEDGSAGYQARKDKDNSERPRFPTVIFSHGLGGSRLCYSTICGELTSYGFVVVAVEHRDGSGARTHVSLPNNEIANEVQLSTAVMHRSEVRGDTMQNEGKKVRKRYAQGLNPYYVMDYIVPQDNVHDTSPANPLGVDTKLRSAQIELRTEEIKEAYYIIGLINNGRGDQIAAINLRKKGNVGSSSIGLTGINWSDWQDRMFLDNVTVMGHSFGGATTVQLCRSNDLTWIGQGIALDPWGQSIPEAGDSLSDKLSKPILSISSEVFMHWKGNFDRVVEFCQEARGSGALCWMLTIVGSTHLSQTDFAVLYPHWLSLFMKTMVHPTRAFHLTMTASLEFLNITLPAQQTKYNKLWLNEELLETPEPASDPEEALKDDHAPLSKWTAVRLSIPNEYSFRAKAWFSKQWRRVTWQLDKEVDLSKGLADWGEDQEIWTHLSPPKGQIEEYQEHLTSRKSTD